MEKSPKDVTQSVIKRGARQNRKEEVSMWLSNRQGQKREEEHLAQLGQVTVAGEETAVYLSGERRQVQQISPGGYHWRPREGESVLVVKAGEEGEPCLLGREAPREKAVQAGEIWISAGGEYGILLRPNGEIALHGWVYANGELLSSPVPKEEV